MNHGKNKVLKPDHVTRYLFYGLLTNHITSHTHTHTLMKLTETKTLTGNWYIVNKFAVRDKMISLKRGTENQGMGTGNGERGTGNL